MSPPRRTTPTLLVCVCLTACQGSPSPSPAPAATEPAGTVAVESRPPRFTGRLRLGVRPALVAVGDTECTPATNRVCSSDGSRSWVPLKDQGHATLVAATTRLNEEHTSWTTVLRFDEGSRSALGRAATDAAATGGVVLLLDDGRALTAVPPPQLHGTRATFTSLPKPEAWALVALFGAG